MKVTINRKQNKRKRDWEKLDAYSRQRVNIHKPKRASLIMNIKKKSKQQEL